MAKHSPRRLPDLNAITVVPANLNIPSVLSSTTPAAQSVVTSGTEEPLLHPGELKWRRDANTEAKFAKLGVKWVWVTDLRVDKLVLTENPTRLTQAIRPDHVEKMQRLRVSTGIELPGLVGRRAGDCYVVDDGNHRTTMCRNDGIPTASGYVMSGVSDDIAGLIATSMNADNGWGTTENERLALMATRYRDNKTLSVDELASFAQVPVERLWRVIRRNDLRSDMIMWGVPKEADNISPTVLDKISDARSSLTDPTTKKIAFAFQGFSRQLTIEEATTILRLVKAARDETSREQALLEGMSRLTTKKFSLGGNKTFGSQVTIEVGRALGFVDRLFTVPKDGDPRTALRTDDGSREGFLTLAEQLIDKLNKVVTILKQ